MPKIDIAAVPIRKGSGYPSPFDQACSTRTRRRLGDAGGLKDFGVNLMTLPPGAWSSQRHWHSHEDEFVYVLEGEVALVEDQVKNFAAGRGVRCVCERYRQRPSLDQRIISNRDLSGSGFATSG